MRRGAVLSLDQQCVAAGLPVPIAEYPFAAPLRRFRFDYAWAAHRVAAEVEGGIWTGGRHTRGAGYERDLEKYNLALELGWRVARFSPAMIASGRALATLTTLLRP